MKVYFLLMLSLVFALSACQSAAPTTITLPAGDAIRGADLFNERINGVPSCHSCHNLERANNIAPSLGGFANRAARRVAGQSAFDYAYISITQPSAYLVEGFSNVMYPQYGTRLEEQQIADLIAFLFTLN